MADERTAGEIERVLRKREEQTLEGLKRLEAAVQAPPGLDGTIGRLTRMDALQQQEMALHGQRRLELQLETIRGALSRVQDGSYGTCVFCGQVIAPVRLEATPETPSCIACQARFEREGRA